MKDHISSIPKRVFQLLSYRIRNQHLQTVKNRIKNGEFQIVFTSPESLLMSMEWKNTLSSKVYRDNLVGFVVDEAHCIQKW